MTTILNVQHYGHKIVATGKRTTDSDLTVTNSDRSVGRFLVRDEPPAQSTLAAEAAATRATIRSMNAASREFWRR